MYEKNHLFWGGLLFYAFNVGAVLGVDANLVAGVAEKGHANGCAGFNGGAVMRYCSLPEVEVVPVMLWL